MGPITSQLGIDTPEKLDFAISKGVLKDPVLIAKAKAEFSAPANPILGALGAPVPGPPPTMDVAPLGEPAKQPYHDPAILPNVPVIPPVKAYAQPTAGPPPGPPAAPPNAPPGPAHKAGSVLLSPGGGGGGSAPAAPADHSEFGYTPHEKLANKQESKHLITQKGFQDQQSANEAAAADEFAATAQGVAADADKRARALEASAAKRKQFLDRFNAETEAKIDDYVKSDVDPNRVFAKAGEGSRFVSMIGIALSGVGQMFKAAAGMDPGRNGALDMIEKTIAQDVELQKAQIAKKGAGIDARKGLYTNYLQQFGNEDAAEAMAYEGYLRKAKATVDAQMAKTTSKEVKIRGEALSEALENRIIQFANGRAIVGEKMYDGYQARLAASQAAVANEKKKRDEMVFKSQLAVGEERAKKIGGAVDVLKEPKQLPNGVVMPAGSVVVYNGAGEIDLSGTEAAAKTSQVATIAGFNAKGQPLYGTGTAFSPEDKKKFDEGAKTYTSIKRDLQIIKDLRTKHGGGALFSAEDVARANAAAKRIQLQMKSPAMYNLGQIAGADTAFLEAGVPSKPLEVKAVGLVGSDPIGVTIDETEKAIDDIYKSAEATHLKGGGEANSALPLTAPK